MNEMEICLKEPSMVTWCHMELIRICTMVPSLYYRSVTFSSTVDGAYSFIFWKLIILMVILLSFKLRVMVRVAGKPQIFSMNFELLSVGHIPLIKIEFYSSSSIMIKINNKWLLTFIENTQPRIFVNLNIFHFILLLLWVVSLWHQTTSLSITKFD